MIPWVVSFMVMISSGARLSINITACSVDRFLTVIGSLPSYKCDKTRVAACAT